MQIILEKYEELFNFKASQKLKDFYNSLDLTYEEISEEEKDTIFKDINDILQKEIKTSGPHRIKDWNNGWNENCVEFKNTKLNSSLVPKYFGKMKFSRINNKFVKSNNSNFEYDCFSFLQSCVYEAYCSGYEHYYEFGCGTGHNLLKHEYFCETKNIVGLDWSTSSQNCIDSINKIKNKDFKAYNFDFENPNEQVKIKNNSVVCTLAALEQIGDRHENFINFLLKNKPSICVHLEPIEEVLDENDEMENLSIKYFKKRKYLTGFLSKLQDLRDKNKIELLETKKTGIGSYFIEGYTLVAWRVL